MPAHPKPHIADRLRREAAQNAASFAYLTNFTDAQLELHIAHLESWVDFQGAEMEAALAELEHRGVGCYQLTPMAEAFLAANAARPEAVL